MRNLSLAVAVTMISLLTSCRGNENSVTGPSNGSGFVSGQVMMVGDLAGASPSGITVASSGQIAVTDAAGRFAFAGLSNLNHQAMGLATTASGRNFSFSRQDGINASGSVDSSVSSVVVELQRNQAKMVSTGQSKREIEGLITAISGSSITVNDASTHGPVTASVSSATSIRKGNQTLAATDLKVGDQVHVKATVNSDGSLTAFDIVLQQSGSDDGGSSGGQTKELEGLITAISAASITVNNASTGGPVTAAITSSTVIRKGNTTLKTTDLKVGDRVHVKTTGSGSSLTATEIMLQNSGK